MTFVWIILNVPDFLGFSVKTPLSISISIISEKVDGFTNYSFSRINSILA